MQVAIDNAKRKYDVDLEKEIPRIKNDMCVDVNKLPLFWQITKKDKRKARNDDERKKRQKANREKIKSNLNESLVCPMNYLYSMDFSKYKSNHPTIKMSEFFINYPLENDRHKSKQIEDLIEKYSFELYKVEADSNTWTDDNLDILLRADFEDLISDIRQVYISKNYRGMMSWLINRAFCIGSGVRGNNNRGVMDSKIDQNKSILMKVLYTVSPKVFLECFTCTPNEN